jgi:WD40 repeat protein
MMLPTSGFSADGSRLVTFSLKRGRASLWNTISGERVATFDERPPITGAALNADGSTVLTWSALSGTAHVWPASGSEPFAVIRQGFFLFYAALRPDAAEVVTASGTGQIRLWDAKSGRDIALLADQAAAGKFDAIFSPDQRRLVAHSNMGVDARLFDTATGAELAHLSSDATVRGFKFSSTSARLVTFGSPAVLWDSESGRRIATLRHDIGATYSNIISGPDGYANVAAFSSDGMRLVTAGEDGSARLWNALDGRQLAVLRGHTAPVTRIALSRKGETLLTVSADRSVRLWDVADGPEVAGLRGHKGPVGALAVTEDGTRGITVGEDGAAVLWNFRTGQRISVMGGDSVGKITNVATDGSGKRFATTHADGTIRVWTAKDGAAVALLHGHEKSVWRISFSPDGTRLLTFRAVSVVR